MASAAAVIATTTPDNPTSLSPASGITGDLNWWSDDDLMPALRLDASEGGLWSGAFVPPPPRPLFLDEAATPDGLTTCDLCSWAWQGHRPYQQVDKVTESAELSWVLTLVIVSVISAAIGAVIMITVLHCKSRMKNNGAPDASQSLSRRPRPRLSTPEEAPTDKNIIAPSNYAISSPSPPLPHISPQPPPGNTAASTGGVWSWLIRRPPPLSSPLTASPAPPAENHYTHMDENYSSVGEALYAELDRDSNSPAYQNSAYTDPDAPTSSAPSSAYYSDLSTTLSVTTSGTAGERAYEVVGLATWDPQLGPALVQGQNPAPGDVARRQQGQRLAAISEAVSVPSDYV